MLLEDGGTQDVWMMLLEGSAGRSARGGVDVGYTAGEGGYGPGEGGYGTAAEGGHASSQREKNEDGADDGETEKKKRTKQMSAWEGRRVGDGGGALPYLRVMRVLLSSSIVRRQVRGRVCVDPAGLLTYWRGRQLLAQPDQLIEALELGLTPRQFSVLLAVFLAVLRQYEVCWAQ
eukprot:175440-Rhodomonas_salina.3